MRRRYKNGEVLIIVFLGVAMFILGNVSGKREESVRISKFCIAGAHLVKVENTIFYCRDYEEVKRYGVRRIKNNTKN